jgi:uncharacterized protein YfaP (DUF2135 family)
MVDNFHIFAKAVRKRFDELAIEPLFVVAADRDLTWERYLLAFPPGSNPIFRKRTEHDCSCCRSFIRNVGNVVAIQNGALSTIWDLNGLPDAYQAVADAMAAYIRSLPVRDIFLTKFPLHGNATTHEMIDGHSHAWSHFSAAPPARFIMTEKIDERRGETRTTHAVLMRGFTELTPEAIAIVADLIVSNSIYRGQEYAHAVLGFQQLQARFLAAPEGVRDLLAWTMIGDSVARFRNTAIGTLVQDLSAGESLEAAVGKYEAKVAPENFKRSSSLITKGMIESAMKTIQELGLEPALERRHARLSDVSVNSVLFVDNAVRARMKGGIEDVLMQEVRPAKVDLSKAQEIGIEEFIRDVLPKSRSISLHLDNGLAPNFASLTAPVHADSGSLFKWPNDFAWSYEGNLADSTIRDRVKAAGGTVEGVEMRVSLAWHNTDDLDLHIREPSGNHIYFADRGDKNRGGYLDVDMNVSSCVRNAVENVRWLKSLRNGVYRVSVHNYRRRESIDVGFTVEIESHLGIHTLRYEPSVRDKEEVPVAVIGVEDGRVKSIAASERIVVGHASRELWGLKTQELARVNAIVLSPNYWTEPGRGNKHWFFILEGCKNPLPTRGVYNEFLHPRLEAHRKVFEVLGDKTKCPVADEQLSGVGFSSTKAGKVSVIAMGPKMQKAYNIVFK